MAADGPVWKDWLRPFAVLAYLLGVAAVVGSVFAYKRANREPPEERRWAARSVRVIEPYERLASYDADTDFTPHAGLAINYKVPNVSVYSSPAPVRSVLLPSSQGLLAGSSQNDVSDGVEKKDPYRVDRVLVATVTKGLEAAPGERLVWTRVFVKPINFRFAGFTVAATANKTLKIADIETTQDSKMDFDPQANAVLPLLSKIGASQAFETTKKASSQITETVEELGIDIKPEFLRIIRESGTGGDVMGNTLIKLSIVTDPNLIRTTAETRQPPQPSERLALSVSSVHLSDGVKHLTDRTGASITVLPQNVLPHCPLIARVWMLYEYRKIIKGGKHYTEGLQSIELLHSGEDVPSVEIVPADDIAPAVWSINYQNGSALTAYAQNDAGRHLPFVFTDYVTASELIHWLKIEKSNRELGGLHFDFQNPSDTLTPTKMTKNDCKELPLLSERPPL